MPDPFPPPTCRVLSPGPAAGTFRTPDGHVLDTPPGWALLPPGDPALTRRVKTLGPAWTVQEKRGRKVFSRGVVAPLARIEEVRAALAVERADPRYQKRLDADAKKRARAQEVYVEDFAGAVRAFLAFHPSYESLAVRLADRVTAHATPVGSGTVARTQRLPLAARAERAVIAWMRHRTSAYDRMVVPRMRGARREIRRQLAHEARRVLDKNRRGLDVDVSCPLWRALHAS